MKEWLICPGSHLLRLTGWVFFCMHLVSGCFDTTLGLKDIEEEPVKINLSGRVLHEVELTPMAEASVIFGRRSKYEDWEWGGYDYEHLGTTPADTNGRYSMSRTLRDCGSWSYYVYASKSTDSLVYQSKSYYLSCSSGSFVKDLLVNNKTLQF